MAGPNDFTSQNISDSYQRVLQISSSGEVTDGTGSLVPILQITASHAISASHEITYELSSSHAVTADSASYVLASNIVQPFNHITASGNISSSGTVIANKFKSSQYADDGTTNNYMQFDGTNHKTNFVNGGTTSATFDNTFIELNRPITASGNISSSGDIRVKRIMIGDNQPNSPSYNLHVKSTTSANVVIETTGNNNASILLKNNQTPDWQIFNKHDLQGLNVQANHSVLHLDDDGTTTISGSLVLSGAGVSSNITASGNISASGTIVGSNLSGTNTGDQTNITGTAGKAAQCNTVTNATDATFYPTFVDSDNGSPIAETHYTAPFFHVNPRRRLVTIEGKLKVAGSSITFESGSISASKGIFAPSITASGDISSSGNLIVNNITAVDQLTTVTGSFNHIITDGDTIEFRNASTKAKEGTLKFDASVGMTVADAAGTDAPFKCKTVTAGTSLISGGTLEVIGNITASGHISCSNSILAKSQTIDGKSISGQVITADVVSSGHISSSANVYAANYYKNGTQIDSRVFGTTLLNGTNGTNNELAIFTDANTVEGDADLTFSSNSLSVKGTIQSYTNSSYPNYAIGGGHGYTTSLLFPGSRFQSNNPAFAKYGSGGVTAAKDLECYYDFVIPAGMFIKAVTVVANNVNHKWTLSSGNFCGYIPVKQAVASVICSAFTDGKATIAAMAGEKTTLTNVEAAKVRGVDGNVAQLTVKVKAGGTLLGAYFQIMQIG